MAEKEPYWAIRGTLVHAPVYSAIEVLFDRLVIISVKDGTIAAITDGSASSDALQEHGLKPQHVHELKEGQLLIPGFIDTHCHAPQYSYTGTATDTPLMRWLSEYTFPQEAAVQDLEAAGKLYGQLVQRLLRNGTTTALYFASLHNEPSLLLARICEEAGQRAFVGKVCMDRNSPADYVQDTATNLSEMESFLVALSGTCLARPVITPRFVPTCTPELLKGLGELAKQHPEALIQSHISESHDAVAFSLVMHPEADGRDARLFDEAGLLTSKGVFAHGVCLTDGELKLMAQRGSAIAHCPLSNMFFADRLLRVNDAKRLGVKIGLATDVAGGYAYSMLIALRTAVITSQAVRMQHLGPEEHGEGPSPANSHLVDYKAAFHLATVGGAEALGIADTVGTFALGKEFDALLIDTQNGATFDMYPSDSLEDLFQKFCNLGDDRNIAGVWVQGKQVHPPASVLQA